MRILNLYSGIGGNRKHWQGDITAVEVDPEIANIYQSLYPGDTVVVGDACEYLEKNYKKFDFIWSSPPCQSHGQYRHNVGVIGKGLSPVIPDMTLYSQVIFLQNYAIGKWVVENVKPYYEPLVKPSFELQRHLFWSNFNVKSRAFKPASIRIKNKISDFDGFEIVALSKIHNKRQVLRNRVDAELGKYILDSAIYC